jgi:hypothetical protein
MALHAARILSESLLNPFLNLVAQVSKRGAMMVVRCGSRSRIPKGVMEVLDSARKDRTVFLGISTHGHDLVKESLFKLV